MNILNIFSKIGGVGSDVKFNHNYVLVDSKKMISGKTIYKVWLQTPDEMTRYFYGFYTKEQLKKTIKH